MKVPVGVLSKEEALVGAFSRYCEISQSPVVPSIAQYSILSALCVCVGKLYSLAASRCDSYLPYMLVGHENNRTVHTVFIS